MELLNKAFDKLSNDHKIICMHFKPSLFEITLITTMFFNSNGYCYYENIENNIIYLIFDSLISNISEKEIGITISTILKQYELKVEWYMIIKPLHSILKVYL